MAYVLGFFYADGGMERSVVNRGWYIRFSSTDKALLAAIAGSLNSKHPLIVRNLPLPNKIGYILRVGDKVLYSALEEMGLHPNKSLSITMPSVPIEYRADFIRGYFDGDGCVFLERFIRKADGKKAIKRLHTSFTSGSRLFLEQLSAMIRQEIGVDSKIYQSDRSYQIRYSTMNSVRLFTYIYRDTPAIFLDRKYRKFATFFSERPDWIDFKIQTILDCCP